MTIWSRSPGPLTKVLFVLTVVMAISTLVLYGMSFADPQLRGTGSPVNVALFVTVLCSTATWLSGRRRPRSSEQDDRNQD